MELRAYLNTLTRRWYALLILPLVALVVVVVAESERSPQYTAAARVSMARVSDDETTNEYEFDNYYDFLVSEFILDDSVEIVRGNVFAAAVSERLVERGIFVDPPTVDGALDASREHRILTIRSTTGDNGLSIIIANAAATEIREDYQDYLGAAEEPLPVTIRPVDISTSAESDSFQVRLTYLLAIIVAAGFGLLVALALEFFDDRLTSETAKAALGLDVLGVVPEDRS